MRRRTFLAALTTAASAAAVGGPVVGASAAPRPVRPQVRRLRLDGVDGPALRQLPGPQARPLLLSAAQGTSPFSMVGVTWARDARTVGVSVSVRVRARGSWSPWLHLEVDGDGPDAGAVDDGGTTRDGTAPMWVGASDGVQVRIDRRRGALPRDVRIELVEPGASPADAPRVRRSAASAGTVRPDIVTRAQWGADETMRRGDPDYTSPAEVGFVHHTASANGYSAAEAAAMVRGVYAFHTRSRGWSDIGYNFLVDRFGRVYEGRAGGVDRWVLGTHTGGHNSGTFAVSLLGTFDRTAPPAVALTALASTLAWKLGLAHRDPRGTTELTSAGGGTSRFPAGSTNSFAVVSGHRDAGSTSCPGAATYARMGEIRRAVTASLGVGFASPALVGPPQRPVGSTAPYVVSARTLTPTAWTLSVIRGGQVVRTLTGVAETELTATWDLLLEGGGRALPGTYVLRLTGTGSTPETAEDTAHPWTTTVHVDGLGVSRWRPSTR